MALTYDAMGNILTKSVGTDLLTYSYEMNGSISTQRLSSVAYGSNPAKSFVHDANGNMTQGWDFSDPANPVQRSIQYNADDKPISITRGLDTTLFTYDANGDRAIKEIAGGDITYYVSGGYEVTNGVSVKYISGGGLSIAKIEDGVTSYQHSDHLGSSTVVTNESGQEIEKSDYRPFGEERNHWGVTNDKHRYTGQEKDFSTGLYNYNARLYDPILGRFTSADIFVPDPLDPQSYNRFAYCRNNPLSYTDPSGHFIVEMIVGAVIGALIGGATEAILGGDILQGMVTGAISGAIFFGVGELGLTGLEQITAHALGGALSGGISSAISGGDIGLGMLTGAIAAGVGEFVGSSGLIHDDFCSQLIGRSVVGAVTGGVASTICGQDFFDGFMQGAKTAAIGFLCNHMLHDAGRFVGASQGEAATQWYAEKYNETGNPIYLVGGTVAALWTPETYADTAMTLFGGAVGGKVLGALGKMGSKAAKFTKVSRWGREGLEDGDFVMKGGKNALNYIKSGKWQKGMGNTRASYSSGSEYMVPTNSLKPPSQAATATFWDKGLFGHIKSAMGQRSYRP
ncbi:RHS repeat domain-containing protein [Desulfatibacillum aliphaticivorans]|uniref:RHS repeat domain-containing protein n=1 Tax=Desulfatibacillum aliphaticivorans TaxID=218208 RepID=UPI000402CA66|nr:RHS repeat-associated core domain-containing protein [Desulfatibacillum aliphaticivorans]